MRHGRDLPRSASSRATDPERYLASDKLVWFDSPGSDPLEVQLRGVPEDQRFAAEVVGSDVDPTTYAGIYGVRPMQLSVPDGAGAGRAVPVAGLTWVGVHPDHRRRGLLTAMMRHHFEQTRREGVHLSALHASEPGIYGRHGYGLASLELEVAARPRDDVHRAPPGGRGRRDHDPARHGQRSAAWRERRRQIDLDLMANERRHDRRRRGVLRRPQPRDGRGERATSEPPRILFAVRDGRDVGYVVFKRKHKWPNSRPAAEVSVRALSPAVRPPGSP